MINFNKYKKKILNYNLLTKKHCNDDFNLDKIILISDNTHIISVYNLLLILLSIKLLFNKKSYIRKSKKSNLFTGLRKNENIGIKCTLRKALINELIKKILFNYSKHIDITRNLFISKSSKTFKLTLKNINKIDNILLQEYKLLKPLIYKLDFISCQKNKTNNYNNLNIYLLLTHLGFKFSFYEE